MTIATCKQCNAPYKQKRFNQYFCREECRRLYWKAKPGYEATAEAVTVEAIPQQEPERAKGTATCLHCSSIYQPLQRFCCDDCRRLYWKAKDAKPVTEPVVTEPVAVEPVEVELTHIEPVEPTTAACQQCGTPYQAKLGKRFCSDKCRSKHRRSVRNELVVAEPVVDEFTTACQHCGTPYQTGPKNKRFCTDKCRRLFKKANRAQVVVAEPAVQTIKPIEPAVEPAVEPTRTVEPDQSACQQCNTLYQAKYGKRFCSDKCRRAYWKANPDKKTDPNTYHPTFVVPDCIWEEPKTGVSAPTIRELLSKLPEGAKIKDYTPGGYEHQSQPLPNPIQTEETIARAKQAIEEARRRLERRKKAAGL